MLDKPVAFAADPQAFVGEIMAEKRMTIDEYLAARNDDQRAVLQKLREAIRKIVPKAEECLSYGIPTFRLDGRMLVSFGATAKHCSFHPLNSTTVNEFAEELKNFDTSKGTIRFQPEKPLPIALVRKIVKARITENAETRQKIPAKK